MLYSLVAQVVGIGVVGSVLIGSSGLAPQGAALHAAKPAQPTPEPAAVARKAAAPICVVELFTSEGCSSCPPADLVANSIGQRAAKEAAGAEKSAEAPRTIVLAFHVDYWDNLGWKDRFAAPAFTQRQRDYAAKLGLRGLYTPQMIINGAAEFVGSDSSRAEREMAKSLATPVQAVLSSAARWKEPARAEKAGGGTGKPLGTAERSVGGEPSSDRTVSVEVTAVAAGGRSSPAALASGALLDVVVVEDGLVSKVLRGENAGSTLRHDRVVRTMVTVPLPASGIAKAEVSLPADAVAANCRIVAVLREPAKLGVLGADEIALPGK